MWRTRGSAPATDRGTASRVLDVDALRLWSLATYRTATFVITIALIVHLDGMLASMLHELDTRTGVAFFLLVWTSTWFASRRGLRDQRQSEDNRDREPSIMYTIVAGAWNGVYVYAALLAVAAISATMSHASPVPGLIVIASAFPIGAVFAFTIGGIVGFAFGVLEGVLFAISGWIAGARS
jgi:hypothetical protein